MNQHERYARKMSKTNKYNGWLHTVIFPQAGFGNNVCVGDYSKDGNTEYLYPKRFRINDDEYCWEVISAHTRGRHLTTHYELLFYGPAFKGKYSKIATGPLTKAKLRKGFRVIYEYYSLKEL